MRFKLVSEVLNLSFYNTWFFAKQEWIIVGLYYSDEPEKCLCGHFPINYVCVIKSLKNGTIAEVGNCCVKRFITSDPDKVFQAYKRVSVDVTRSLNSEALNHAFKNDWIDCFDWFFYFNIMAKKRKTLSPHELEKKKKISNIFINRMKGSKKL